MKIYFIRHGNKERENENSPLTKKGIKQSKILGKRLNKFKFDEIYCSDLIRAKQTLKNAFPKPRNKIIIEESLNEFKTEVLKKDGKNLNDKKRLENLKKFLKKITENTSSEKNILIISHGNINRILLSFFLSLNLSKTIYFRQNETGINEISYSKKYKNWRLERWNDFSHLPKNLE
jgi:broad specificity phosphatase PhoE